MVLDLGIEEETEDMVKVTIGKAEDPWCEIDLTEEDVEDRTPNLQGQSFSHRYHEASSGNQKIPELIFVRFHERIRRFPHCCRADAKGDMNRLEF